MQEKPKGKFDTPGPFMMERQPLTGVFEINRVSHKGGFVCIVPVLASTPECDEGELEELVGLLNKGTHFDGMLKALREILSEHKLEDTTSLDRSLTPVPPPILSPDDEKSVIALARLHREEALGQP